MIDLGRGNKNKNSTSQGLYKHSNRRWMKGRPAGATLMNSGPRSFPLNARDWSCKCMWKYIHMKAVISQLSKGRTRKILDEESDTRVCAPRGNHRLRNYDRWTRLKWQFSFRLSQDRGRLRGTVGSCQREREPRGWERECLLQGKLRIKLFICFTCWGYPKAGQHSLKTSKGLNEGKLHSAVISHLITF